MYYRFYIHETCHLLFSSSRPESKEGKSLEMEKSNEQDNETDKIEKELEKDKVNNCTFEIALKRFSNIKM